MSPSPRSIEQLLEDSESPLARLLARAHRLQRLEARLHAALDPRLSDEVRVVALEAGTITLVTPRAGVATRLRLETAAIIRALQGSGAGRIEKVNIRVAPLPAPVDEHRRKRELPASARSALERFARDNGYGSLAEMLEGPAAKDEPGT